MTTKVLILDDNIGVTLIIEKILKDNFKNMAIDKFNNSLEVIKIIEENNFDYNIAFLDNAMPNIEGISIIEEIRARKYNVYIILVSAMAEGYLTSKYKGIINEMILKPFEESQIINIVEYWFDEIKNKNQTKKIDDNIDNILVDVKAKDRLLIKDIIKKILKDDSEENTTYQKLNDNYIQSARTLQRNLNRIFNDDIKKELNERTGIGCLNKVIKNIRKK